MKEVYLRDSENLKIRDSTGQYIKVPVSDEVYKCIQESNCNLWTQKNYNKRKLQLTYFESDIWDNALFLTDQLSAEDEYYYQQEQKKDTPPKKTVRDKRLKQIYKVLATCTPKQQKRFLLHVVDGLSYRDIAKLQNREYKSIKQSIDSVYKKFTNVK